MAFSCKRQCLCPSCHKQRQIELGEFVAGQILEPVPHRHRLAKLAHAADETLKEHLQIAADSGAAVPGAVACIQSYGHLLDWHRSIHLVTSWWLFTREADFLPVSTTPDTEILEKLFRHKVLRLLLDEGASDERVVTNLLAWPHTGFGAHASRAIPVDPHPQESVARHVAHPPILVDWIRGDPSGGRPSTR